MVHDSTEINNNTGFSLVNAVTSFNILKMRIVNANVCCGCGGCAAACPTKAIVIRFNAAGEYQPNLVGDCTQCNRCVKACPFLFDNPNLDELGRVLFGEKSSIKHLPETGYYHRCFVGSASDEQMRLDGSSGGLLTSLLCGLLKMGVVDFVVTAAPNQQADKLFKYAICTHVEEVRTCSKSAYYPFELSEILETISIQKGRYVVVGIPCTLKALRHAQSLSPVVKNRVVLALGLVCGKNKSKLFTDVLIRKAGLEDVQIKSVCYRDKRETQNSADFYFTAQGTSQKKRLLWSQGWNKIFTQSWFDLGPCRVCDDIFAECADAAFMDAWLPEYVTDTKGTSLILSRNEQLSQILAEIASDIPVEKVIASQWGVILRKRKFLDWELKQIGQGAGRSYLALAHGWKRYLPHHLIDLLQTILERGMSSQVRAVAESEGDWFGKFQENFTAWQYINRFLTFLSRSISFPFSVCRRIKRWMGKYSIDKRDR